MRKFTLCPVVLLALALSCQAQSITVPATVTVDQPGLIVIRATMVDADDARWYMLSSGIETFPIDVIPPKLGTFLGFAMQPGTYTIGVIPAKAINGKAIIGTPIKIVVTVNSGGPTPPTPPTPPPALVTAVQQAFAAETDPLKAQQASSMATVYRYGANAIADTTNVTWDDLYSKMSAKAAALGVTGKLPVTQQVIATAELKAVPNSATPTSTIAAAERTTDAALYLQAAAALDTLNTK